MSGWLEGAGEPGLVSVVIPTCNREKLLGEALASILAQTYGKVEAVVVDDGSEDGTAEAAAGWRERFGAERGWELRFFRQEHLGGQRARNRGATESRGEYLNFLDDDDLFTADKIERQMEVARSSGADIVYGPWMPFVELDGGYDVERPHCRKPITVDGDPFEAWLEGRSWYVMTALMSREFLRKVGPWDEELGLALDTDYAARCLRRAPRMAHCPGGALYRRKHRASLSHKSLADYEDSLVRFVGTLEGYVAESLPGEAGKRALAQYLGRHAVSFRLMGSVRAADYFGRKALEYDPDYRPRNAGRSSALAYRIGGFGLWILKSRARKRLKKLRRFFRPGRGGARKVPELDLSGFALAEG